ncbi:MAG: T9SS type A sorting domain-containing protein [Bacteroidia bacterium]
MKKLLLILSLCTALFSNAQTTVYDTIISGGVKRSYILYIPAIYNASHATPLVFNFHGYTSTNVQQAFYANFSPVADTANFIIVLPQGLSTGGNTGWANFGTVASASADINFVSNLIDTLSAQYNVNSNRIYSTGLSNGGFMSYDLACFLNNRFAAIASVAGSMVASHITSCNPARKIPVMEIHGTTDPTVSYSGTSGIVASTNIDSLVKFWVKFNNCNQTPTTTSVTNISTTDNCTAIHYTYDSQTTCGSTVEFFQVVGGGHTWPGASYILPVGSSGNTNEDFNACKEIWRFFSKCDATLTGISQQVNPINQISLYPNPSTGTFTLAFQSTLSSPAKITISNILGEEIYTSQQINTTQQISLTNAANGTYFVHVQGADGNYVQKVIVNR